MKIGIYEDPSKTALGGAEVCVAVLAAHLSSRHNVTVLHHREGMTAEELAQHADVTFKDVQLRLIGDPPRYGEGVRSSWRRFRTRKAEEEAETASFDLFISFNHQTPFFSAARLSLMIVLFPFYDPWSPPFDGQSRSALIRHARGGLQRVFHNLELKARLRRYDIKAAISDFSRAWTQRRWKVECGLLFPPVAVSASEMVKSNWILSVGRFALPRQGHGKKQMEMLANFAALQASGVDGWQYHCTGGCGSAEDEQEFLQQVKTVAAQSGAVVHASIDRRELENLYLRSKIFWHATGMDVDEERSPELLEHFGMSTVEAMAAGCVPVVVNKGGQKEIVEHGVSGFLWDTVDEWRNYTSRLMQDEVLWTNMSKAARERARVFSRETFVERFRTLVGPHVQKNGMSL